MSLLLLFATGVNGAGASVIGAPVSAASAGHGVAGSSATTIAAPTSTGTAKVVTFGSAANTIPGAVSAASALIGETGTSSGTAAAFVQAATALQGEVGSAADTIAAFTSTATGTYTAGNVTGTAADTIAAFTSIGQAVVPDQGSATDQIQPFTSGASGKHGEAGSSARTIANFVNTVVAGTGETGSAAQSIDIFTQTSSALHGETGSIVYVLPITSTGVGAQVVVGSSAVTLPITSTASAFQLSGAVGAQTIDPFISVGSAVQSAIGHITDYETITGQGLGAVGVSGFGASTYANAAQSVYGAVVVIGYAANVIEAFDPGYALHGVTVLPAAQTIPNFTLAGFLTQGSSLRPGPYRNLYASVCRVCTDTIADLRGVSHQLQFRHYQALTGNVNWPEADVLGIGYFETKFDMDGRLDASVAFAVSTYQDKNLFRHAQIIDTLLAKLVPGQTELPLVHATGGQKIGYMRVAGLVHVMPIERAETRAVQYIVAKFRTSAAYDI